MPGIKISQWFAHYGFRSLFFRHLCLLFALILVPVSGASVLGSFALQHHQANQVNAYCEKTAAEVSTTYNSLTNEVYMELVYFGISPEVELFMVDHDFHQQYYRPTAIENLISMPVIVKNYVRSVYLYAAGSQMIIDNNGATPLDSFVNRESTERCLARPMNERTLLTTSVVRSLSYKCISVCSNISYGTTSSGLAVANLDRKMFIREFDVPDNLSCCIAKDGVVWLATDVSLLDRRTDEIGWTDDGSGAYHYHGHHDPASGMDILLRLNMTDFQNDSENYRLFILLFVLIVAWITAIFAFFISNRLFQPIHQILETIRKYDYPATGEAIHPLAKNELEYILSSISKTISSKRAMDMELAKRVSLLKQAQAVALQAQINPHFLNNTLETINWIAIDNLGRENEISDIATNLSLLLRLALDTTQTIVSVRTEIEHCKCYLGIQQKRYEEKLDVVWDIAPEILDCQIVKLVLQPLVENAIYHGIKPKEGKGRITISGRLNGDAAELTVSDDGIGMTAEALRAMTRALDSDAIPDERHIGVMNVNQRLRLMFGKAYGISIRSAPNAGTDVTIRIPKAQ